MKLDEYTGYDGLGLAALVRSGQVSPSELADTAQSAINAVNPTLNAVIGPIEPRPPAADRRAVFWRSLPDQGPGAARRRRGMRHGQPAGRGQLCLAP
jgi:amidase